MADRDEQKEKIQPTTNNDRGSKIVEEFFVVGIGASAGGLEALETFFTNMEPKSGLAFVVIQHLSPDYKSLMVEILAKHTTMSVHEASDGLNVEPNNIYLIPPKKNMTIFHYQLQMTDKGVDQGLNLPIDIFLHSLAADLGEKAIAIILSGTGSDGTRGIRAIKEQDGMVMAQDEYSAKFDGMPRSAVATQLVDYVLPPHQMARQLLNYVQHPCLALRPRVKPGITTDDDDETLSKIFAAIRSRSGVDFSLYKQSTMIRRIERRMSINQIESLEQYLHSMYRSPAEIDNLYKELLIGVTRFFRDEEAFEILKVKVLPQIFDGKRNRDQLRVWVAGCSTGEEAYSLAILLQEQLETENRQLDVKVFATDVDQVALELASKGVYPESIAADVSRERLEKYFLKKGDHYEVQRFVREMVIFARQNLFKDPPFSKIDLISCRNVLIYLESTLQKKAISMFQFALKPEGFLFLGTSETVGAEHDVFQIQHTKWKIYRHIGRFRSPIEPLLSEMNKHPPERHRLPVKFSGDNRTTSRSHLNEAIYHHLIEAFVSACVVVNQEANLLHVFGDVDQFLQVPSGGPFTSNILKMVRSDLSIALSTAIHRALRDQTEVVYKNMNVRNRQGMTTIDMSAKPFKAQNQQQPLVFIRFEPVSENGDDNLASGELYNIDQKVNQRIVDLEQELKYTKENLQATIEELETSNEELQATNEELMAANEELQSTNEELQSVNEELITVNAEFQAKIQELTELNNDMANLLRNTEIGTIFLDSELCVRKFTPAVQDDVKLLEQDIGRPLNHIAHNLKNYDLAAAAERVLHTLQNSEKEIESTTGRWYLVRVRPYNTAENVIKGVVITLVDISRLKSVEVDLMHSEARYEGIVQDQVELLFRFKPDGTLTFVNQMFCDYFDAPREKLIGQNILNYLYEEDRTTMTSSLKELSAANPMSALEQRVKLPNGRAGWQLWRSRAILNEQGQTVEYQTTALDITEKKALKAELERQRSNHSENAEK